MKYLRLFETDAAFVAAKDSFPSGANVSYVRETDDVHILNIINLDDLPIGPFIDLGLPSGKKWASCNLGATKPCDYGDYYMWGSTTPNTDTTCDWAHAPFNNGASSYDGTYFASVSGDVCPNGVLAAKYDAVAVATNGAAHMPTKEDYDELLANTTSEWVTCVTALGHEGHTAVNGRLFTSKTDSAKKIFIPASGLRGGSSFNSGSSFNFQGSQAGLWSSSLNASYPNDSWYLLFNSGSNRMNYFNRSGGQCVRGVAKAIPPSNEIWYTTTDGNILDLSEYWEGETPTSNTYENGVGKFVFTNPITVLTDAFNFEGRGGDTTKLLSVTLPNSVTSIGNSAFAYCSSLTSITIPDGVTIIGMSAFTYCSSLTSITIPDGVTIIGMSAFAYCSSLTSITYNGTKTQWFAITKGTIWKLGVSTSCIVHCTDGDVAIVDA